tara:strand:+ start:338 stop:610 length:273 start_codon:yes stop_codon:yes gene_type:complete
MAEGLICPACKESKTLRCIESRPHETFRIRRYFCPACEQESISTEVFDLAKYQKSIKEKELKMKKDVQKFAKFLANLKEETMEKLGEFKC